MLCSLVTVAIPADVEIEADIAEYGEMSTKLRAAFGVAAMEAGDPDFECSDVETSASDAIANILHHVASFASGTPGTGQTRSEIEQAAVLRVMRSAMFTYENDPVVD